MRQPLLMMGVSGCGKSTVGALLAKQTSCRFVDGDDLHPAENKHKMAAGIALTDADRAPWLDAIAQVLSGGDVVVACSALRRRYRDRLRESAPALRLIYLKGSRELLQLRLASRQHGFMPASLLDSQLATLEEPDPDEHAMTFEIAIPADRIASRILESIR